MFLGACELITRNPIYKQIIELSSARERYITGNKQVRQLYDCQLSTIDNEKFHRGSD